MKTIRHDITVWKDGKFNQDRQIHQNVPGRINNMIKSLKNYAWFTDRFSITVTKITTEDVTHEFKGK